jgi:hypothetical protein
MNIDFPTWLTDWVTAQLDRVDLPSLLGRVEPASITVLTLMLTITASVLLSVPKITWRWTGLFTTLVHELGHAFAALLAGRVVHGIQVRQNHGGSTVTAGYGPVSAVFAGFFGYPAPALVGAGLLWSVFHGYQTTAFLAGTVIIGLTILFIRNWFGALVVFASGAISWGLWYFGSATVHANALLIIGVVLLVGSVRGLATVINVHVRHREELGTSDAYILYDRTGIPSPLWLAGFASVITWCLWAAGLSFAGQLP